MEKREIIIQYKEYEADDTLPEKEKQIVDSAFEAIEGSYAPYSLFHVGAALLLSDGKIIKGSNQENSAYPSGLCAERVALFHAKSQYPDSVIDSIAIAAKTDRFSICEPISPCGACRQVIAEAEKRQGRKIKVIMAGEGGKARVVDGIDNLLPFKFQEENLKKTKNK